MSGAMTFIILSDDIGAQVYQRFHDFDIAGDDSRVQWRLSTIVRHVPVLLGSNLGLQNFLVKIYVKSLTQQ